MIDLIRKSMLLGLGTMAVTKEKVEALVDDLVKKGEIAQEEKPKFVKEMMEKFQKEEKEMTAKIKQTVEKTIEDMGLATKKDIQSVLTRLDQLENKFTSSKK
jgi:poly(hydroxyalkanoate) granule-associated protein